MLSQEEILIKKLGIPSSSHNLPLQGQIIHYLVVGHGQPLVLLHGINFGWGEWYKTIPELAKYFTVYAIDLPGSGSSSRINFNKIKIASLYPNIVSDFVRCLKLKDIFIVGHSIGGWIALTLAIKNELPIKKIAVTNSLGFSEYLVWKQRALAFSPIARFLSITAMKPTKKNIHSFLKGVFYNPEKLPPELVDYYHQAVVEPPISHPFLLINQLVSPFYINDDFVLTDKLYNINVPTAIFAGEFDPLIPLKQNQKNFSKIKGQVTVIIPESGHVPQIERPDLFNRHLINFLNI